RPTTTWVPFVAEACSLLRHDPAVAVPEPAVHAGQLLLAAARIDHPLVVEARLHGRGHREGVDGHARQQPCEARHDCLLVVEGSLVRRGSVPPRGQVWAGAARRRAIRDRPAVATRSTADGPLVARTKCVKRGAGWHWQR